MPRRLAALVAAALLAAGCGPGEPDGEALLPGTGAATPTEAVTRLVEHLNAGEFAEAAPLAMPSHAALASLAEGATFGEIADALREPDVTVTANFWGGFAQGSGGFLVGAVSVSEGEVLDQDGVEYHTVIVVPEAGGEREMVTREADGYRVDLFASFAPGLAERMTGPVERLLTIQTDDSLLILSELRDVVPSLLVAAGRPGQPPDVVQAVLRLVELITRVG